MAQFPHFLCFDTKRSLLYVVYWVTMPKKYEKILDLEIGELTSIRGEPWHTQELGGLRDVKDRLVTLHVSSEGYTVGMALVSCAACTLNIINLTDEGHARVACTGAEVIEVNEEGAVVAEAALSTFTNIRYTDGAPMFGPYRSSLRRGTLRGNCGIVVDNRRVFDSQGEDGITRS